MVIERDEEEEEEEEEEIEEEKEDVEEMEKDDDTKAASGMLRGNEAGSFAPMESVVRSLKSSGYARGLKLTPGDASKVKAMLNEKGCLYCTIKYNFFLQKLIKMAKFYLG